MNLRGHAKNLVSQWMLSRFFSLWSIFGMLFFVHVGAKPSKSSHARAHVSVSSRMPSGALGSINHNKRVVAPVKNSNIMPQTTNIASPAPVTRTAFDLPMVTQAPFAYLVDMATGTVLLSKNAQQRTPPSSMTKILTTYRVLQLLHQGVLRWDDEFVVSENAARREGTSMWLAPGKTVSVRNLLQGIVVLSANNACAVLAEGIAGSEMVFAQELTQLAHHLGARHSHFVNASGLPDEQHWSTCADLATISMRLIQDFPKEYGSLFSMRSFGYKQPPHPSKNMLLHHQLADGVKTGFTKAGGYGMVASAVRGGRRLVLVVNGLANEVARFRETKRLLDWGFRNYHHVSVIKKGQIVFPRALVWQGSERALVAAKDVSLCLPAVLLGQAQVVVRTVRPIIPPACMDKAVGQMLVTIPQPNSSGRARQIIATVDLLMAPQEGL